MKITSIKKIMKEQHYELKRGHNYLINVGVGDMPKESCKALLEKFKEVLDTQGIKNVILVPDSSASGTIVVDIKAK